MCDLYRLHSFLLLNKLVYVIVIKRCECTLIDYYFKMHSQCIKKLFLHTKSNTEKYLFSMSRVLHNLCASASSFSISSNFFENQMFKSLNIITIIKFDDKNYHQWISNVF